MNNANKKGMNTSLPLPVMGEIIEQTMFSCFSETINPEEKTFH